MGNLSFHIYEGLIHTINNSFIPVNSEKDDNPIRGLNTSGLFSSNSVYSFLYSQGSTLSAQDTSFTWIEKLDVPNKIKSFTWLLAHSRLPTNKYLHNVGIHLNLSCTFCNYPEESIHHIFNAPIQKLSGLTFANVPLIKH